MPTHAKTVFVAAVFLAALIFSHTSISADNGTVYNTITIDQLTKIAENSGLETDMQIYTNPDDNNREHKILIVFYDEGLGRIFVENDQALIRFNALAGAGAKAADQAMTRFNQDYPNATASVTDADGYLYPELNIRLNLSDGVNESQISDFILDSMNTAEIWKENVITFDE
jgi:hypothetical protein